MAQNSPRPVAVVTGGSSGIGRATALILAAHGFRVFAAARETERAGPFAGVDWMGIDVSDDASVVRGVSEIQRRCGRIDVLVNNAGYGLMGALEETSIEEAKRQFETNFWGVVRMINACLPGMRAYHRGRIVNVSSLLGVMPGLYQGYYTASKHALEGYSEVLDHEVRTHGIRVVLVEPTFTRTNFFRAHDEAATHLDAYTSQRQRVIETTGERVKTGDDPDTVARTVVKAATIEDPAIRYTTSLGATFMKRMHDIMPAPLMDYGLRKAFHMDDHPVPRRRAGT